MKKLIALLSFILSFSVFADVSKTVYTINSSEGLILGSEKIEYTTQGMMVVTLESEYGVPRHPETFFATYLVSNSLRLEGNAVVATIGSLEAVCAVREGYRMIQTGNCDASVGMQNGKMVVVLTIKE